MPSSQNKEDFLKEKLRLRVLFLLQMFLIQRQIMDPALREMVHQTSLICSGRRSDLNKLAISTLVWGLAWLIPREVVQKTRKVTSG